MNLKEVFVKYVIVKKNIFNKKDSIIRKGGSNGEKNGYQQNI